MVAETETSTRPPNSSGMQSWEKPFRMATLGFLVALILSGLLGFIGVRTVEVGDFAGGYTFEVTHATITRPGISTPFSMSVVRDDGSSLPSTITIRIESAYLDMFDDHQIEPIPAQVTRTVQWTRWTFDTPPDSDRLDVFYDGRLDPSVQWGERASARLELDGVDPEVRFSTFVLP